MAEDDDRRIEPRPPLSGSGMLTDPERIRDLEAEAARRERAWRKPPRQGFGDVLGHAEKKRFERLEVYTPSDERLALEGEDRRRKRPGPGEDAGDGEDPPAEDGATDEGQQAAGPAPVALPEAPRGPAVPPDPRMAALHRMLDEKAGAPGKAPEAPRKKK